MFQRTTAVNKLLSLTKRKKIIQGGTWAGKTYGIMSVLIDYCIKNKGVTLTVVAETIPALKKGALKDFTEIMMLTGRWRDSNYNATDRQYRFSSSSSVIEFNSFESVGKAQAAGKRTDLFINEAPYIAYDIADALIMRTSNNVWIDFNPTSEFWAHTEILRNPDAEFLLLKYTDNEALPLSIYNELMMKIEKARDEERRGIKGYWSNWVRVYVDGEIGSLQGAVFTNWSICESIPSGAELISYGLDFGFTNDPTAMVEVYKQNGELYVNELLYESRLTNSDIVKKIQFVNRDKYIVADSAEPKSIEDLTRAGFKVEGANKGKDSIKSSIDTLQQFKINVTSTSFNLIKELRGYRWLSDKDGKSINEPIDFNNHAIDALRYVALNKINKNTEIVFAFRSR